MKYQYYIIKKRLLFPPNFTSGIVGVSGRKKCIECRIFEYVFTLKKLNSYQSDREKGKNSTK